MKDVEFRDGWKPVPDHVADLMATIETYTMTYEEALEKMNNGLLTERLAKAQSTLIRDHLERFGIE